MAEDPNETARHAFGDGAPMPPPASPSAVPRTPQEPAAAALSDWSTRAAAFVLDALFLLGVSFLVVIAAMLIVGTSDRARIELISYVIGIPITLLYAPLLMARRGAANGQTLGKQMMEIRVVRTDGERVTFWTGVRRQIVGQQLLMMLTLYVYALFDYLWPLRDARNQALHDKIAGTLVVRTGAPMRLARETPAEAEPAEAEPAGEAPARPSPRRVDEAPVHSWLPPSAGD